MKLVDYANKYLNPLDYRDVDGKCSLCHQPAITHRHNCQRLRQIATEQKASEKKIPHVDNRPYDPEQQRAAEGIRAIRQGRRNYGC